MSNYSDSYLSSLVTTDRQNRAISDVDLIGTFNTSWRDRLIVLRTYILICQESVANSDDIFSKKLQVYSDEFNKLLSLARADSTGESVFASIGLYRA
jgi:hypothetical protein